MRTKQAVIVSMLACLLLSGCGVLGPLFETDDNDATQQASMLPAAGTETTSTGEPASAPPAVRRKVTRIDTTEEDNKGAGEVPNANSDTKPDPVESGTNLLISLSTLLPPPWNVIVASGIGGGATWWNMNRKRKKTTKQPASPAQGS